MRIPSDALIADTVDYRALLNPDDNMPVGFFDSRGLTSEIPRVALLDNALAAATGLAHHGVRRGDCVILLAPTGPDYLTVLLACLLTGVAPCTVAPPTKPADPASAGVRHLHAAIAAVRPAAVIIADHTMAVAMPVGTPPLTIDDLRGRSSISPNALPPAEPDMVHHIQLTSGSTSAPKAVLLTHTNVAAHLAVLASAAELQRGRDGIFSWLPLYHDMGLVKVLLALTSGVGLDLMPPVGFLRDPLSWLRRISERGATITAAPPFAYRAAADRQNNSSTGSLDLSGLRQAYVGAEPIPVTVLQQFHDTFTEYGLGDDVLIPCYGMAETVLATTLALDPAPTTDLSFGRVRWQRFDRALLDERHLAAPAVPGCPARSIVSCGAPIAGLTLRIANESGQETREGQVGAIHVRGISVMAGYLTANGVNTPPDGWHDTGDLGLRHSGELYVVGRTKEMLIVRGRNLPPYDVEAVIEQHPHVGAGASAVFSYPTEDKGTETIIAVIETRVTATEWPNIRSQITTAVREVFGLTLAEVVILPRGGIPRTSSGKRQRTALRTAYLTGQLS